MRAGKSILFEGAQGTLLDIDHGTYPYVTSSNASIGGVCTGPRRRPARHRRASLGVVKAYTTRVGEGPLPTELSGEMGNRLRDSGNEYGAVTGRPRRCGWYDAVAVRYGVRINGLDALALTKLDVLDGLERIEICTAYRCGDADADGVSVGRRAAGRLRAGVRIAAGLDDADAGHAAVRGSARRTRGATSRVSRRCPACRPRSSRPARSATTPSSRGHEISELRYLSNLR